DAETGAEATKRPVSRGFHPGAAPGQQPDRQGGLSFLMNAINGKGKYDRGVNKPKHENNPGTDKLSTVECGCMIPGLTVRKQRHEPLLQRVPPLSYSETALAGRCKRRLRVGNRFKQFSDCFSMSRHLAEAWCE